MQKQIFRCVRDGLTISGTVYGRDDIRKPAVILSHGFLANQKMCTDYAKLLESMGYVCFTFDFNGGGLGSRSSGKSEDMTIGTEVNDLQCVLDYVRKLPYVNEKDITLLGCSQGGFVSALVAKEYPNEVARLILLYPAFCIPEDARNGKMMFYKFNPKNIPDVLGHFPMKVGGNYAREVIDMDAYQEIRGYNGPVLYLQGTEDNVVSTDIARQAKEAYPNCAYYEIEGGGHMFRGQAEYQARALIEKFMRKTS